MKWLREYVVFGMVALCGVGILIYGVWEQVKPEKAVVEIIKSREQNNKLTDQQTEEIVVDVAGAVQQPGVYRLPNGSRIGDVLVLAGGLASLADRAWVASTINLAQELKDGGKIYIPSLGNNQTPNSNNQTNSNTKNSQLININTASVGELDRLPGIGEVRAAAIVANRPYTVVEEIVSKAKIPQSVYEEIKDQVTIY